VSFVPGQVGQAFHFNGLDSYVELYNSPSLNPTIGLTLDAWINPEKYNSAFPGSSAMILGRDSGYQLRLMSDTGRLRLFAAGNSGVTIDSVTAVPLNVWTRVTGTYDTASGLLRLYINGVLDASQIVLGPIADQVPRTTDIGGLNIFGTGLVSQFTGRIDEAAIYDRALTPAEVTALFNGGAVPVSPPSTKGVVVDLPLGKATGLGMGVTRIQNVIGTAFDDILVGNSGGSLSGGAGRDLLIAGPAAATLDGGLGDDILVGGTTVSDLDLAALDAILADWSDTQSDYATRVARLRAGRLATGQVASNGRKNTLVGGDDLNVFFASPLDLTNPKNGETVFPL
jgi:Concanavalin A-like lectin/glucanases superfamily